ncbi:hypothetical protein [Cohnella nanjingensis]|uniref:Signal transduction histidine kinase n=1 Tax=Cohnella nanjingensis TaxID=1387779 RepID=A0A7X0RUF7_9BACL|nr:hypothetical protein [Cohnella nanjingensis]MBB6673889.1 hypothetical protein [Cohnella nanjingensis]
MDAEATLIYAIASFGLAAVLIWQRASIPAQLRRGMAIVSLLLVAFAFFLIVYSFFSAGT